MGNKVHSIKSDKATLQNHNPPIKNKYVVIFSRYWHSTDPYIYLYTNTSLYNGQTGLPETGTCSLFALASLTCAKKHERGCRIKTGTAVTPHACRSPEHHHTPLLCQAHIAYAPLYTGLYIFYNDRPIVSTEKNTTIQ